MGASRSALAFIYDSQKGHKRRERGWSLWLPLSAIVRPCLAHPLLRAGIPSLITGHPPRCRSNAVIKAVWESGAFVQLECSAINRLRPKVINCVTKEARATTGRGRIGKASACLLHRLHLRGFSPSCGLSTSNQYSGDGCIQDKPLLHHRAALLGPMSWPWIFSSQSSPQMQAGKSCCQHSHELESLFLCKKKPPECPAN